ncbi:MAG: hypothetical protein IJ004_02210 [Clostridia bacterium]|nr:hypothetical protein [Clostridia bacterium]
MKKFLSILLVFLMMLSMFVFVSCENEQRSDEPLTIEKIKNNLENDGNWSVLITTPESSPELDWQNGMTTGLRAINSNEKKMVVVAEFETVEQAEACAELSEFETTIIWEIIGTLLISSDSQEAFDLAIGK